MGQPFIQNFGLTIKLKMGQPVAWFIVSVDKMAGGAFCGDQCTQRVVLGVMDIIGTAGLYEIPGLVIKLP